ncbi:MFS transporter [Brevibacillus fluminis]|uniref:MFS transporter n=1 Tax=Brevibacillus fluminis TaxID=511487 RepID=UPI003F8ABDF7
MKEVFGNRNFRKLFFANLFSGFGQGMSMIGISWYLVETTGSAQLLGSTMLISAVLMFFVGPYLGTLIDRFSRKNILLIENIVGFTVLIMLGVWGFFAPYGEWMLILIYMMTGLIFQVHYPAQSALVQEGFAAKHYNDINSLLEIESQTASVLAGGFAGIILSKMGLHYVLLFNALTYLFAYLQLARMAYTFTLAKQASSNAGVSWFSQFAQSWAFIRERKGFLLFGITAQLPFISVMAGNLLAPVFVNQTLKADVLVYSLSDMTYAVGAVAAGFLIMSIARRLGDYAAMTGMVFFFALIYFLIVAIPNGWAYITLFTFVGWSNAATRLIRQSVYMLAVPKHLMGRVLSFMNSLGMLMRLLLIGLFTWMLDLTGAAAGYLILGILLLVAGIGIMASMRKVSGQIPAHAEDLSAIAEQS